MNREHRGGHGDRVLLRSHRTTAGDRSRAALISTLALAYLVACFPGSVAFSPDSMHFAYVARFADHNHLYIGNRDSLEVRELTRVATPMTAPSFVDGDDLVVGQFVSQEQFELAEYHIVSGERRVIARVSTVLTPKEFEQMDMWAHLVKPSVSKDGQRIAFWIDGHVIVVDRKQGRARVLPHTTAYLASFDSTDTHLLFLGKSVGAPSAPAAAAQSFPLDQPIAVPRAGTPKGDVRPYLAVYDLANGETRYLEGEFRILGCAGNTIIAVEEEQLIAIDENTLAKRVVMAFDSLGYGVLCGKVLYCCNSRDASRIERLELDTLSRTPLLTLSDVAPVSLGVSPDRKTLVVALTTDVDDNAPIPLLLDLKTGRKRIAVPRFRATLATAQEWCQRLSAHPSNANTDDGRLIDLVIARLESKVTTLDQDERSDARRSIEQLRKARSR